MNWPRRRNQFADGEPYFVRWPRAAAAAWLANERLGRGEGEKERDLQGGGEAGRGERGLVGGVQRLGVACLGARRGGGPGLG